MEIVKIFKIRREYYSEFNFYQKEINNEILKVETKLFNILFDLDSNIKNDNKNKITINHIRIKINLQNLISNEVEQYFYIIRNNASNEVKGTFNEEHLHYCINYLYLKILEIKEKDLYEIESFLKKIKTFYENIGSNKKLTLKKKISIIFFYNENIMYKMNLTPKKIGFKKELFDDKYDIKIEKINNNKDIIINNINILKKLILNINEKSAFFELSFFESSGTGNNKLNKEITYILSLLSMNEIKQMLLDIISEFILRECNYIKYNGYYSL